MDAQTWSCWYRGAMAVLLISIVPGTSWAEDVGSVWFGLASPEQRQKNREAMFNDVWVDLGYRPLSLRLPASDDPYQEIAGETLLRYTREITAFSEESRTAGDPLWGRIAGLPAAHKTAEYVAQHFEAAGLQDVHIDSFPRSAQWWPLEWEVRLMGGDAYGEGTKDYVFNTAFPAQPSTSLPEEGMEAELIYVGLGRPEDLVGRNLSGKIAIVNSILDSSAWSHSARGIPQKLVAKGAIGVITLIDVQSNDLFLGAGAGAEGAPCFVISGDDGYFLRDVIGLAGEDFPLKVRMKLTTAMREDLDAHNAIGFLEGRSEETIVLTAHSDAYFYGAQDNASGIATLVRLAEHAAARDEMPKRSMMFVVTGGHHARSRDGRTGSVGAANVRERYPEIMARTVFVLNIEHTAAIGTRLRMGVLMPTNTERARVLAVTNRSPLLISLMGEAFDRYGVVTTTRTNHVPSGDAGGFARAGITVVNFIESSLWYHSSGDIADRISEQGLERTARAFAHFLDQVDTASLDQILEGASN